MATELISNGSFETGTGTVPTGWTATGAGKMNSGIAGTPNGAKIYALGSGSANHGGTLQQTIATEPGKTYTLTFKAGVSWEASAGRYDTRLKVEMLDGSTLIEDQDLTLPMLKSAGYLTQTITFTATSSQTTIKFTDTSPNGQPDFDIGLDMVSVQEAPSYKQTGEWGDVVDWPLVGIHAVITPDGKLLTFGTDQKVGPANFQSAMIHDVWDPVTGQHHTLDHGASAASDVFCSAAIILPGTTKILIGGGDQPQAGNQTNNRQSTVYDDATHQMTQSPEGDLVTARWYPTMISLPTGQILVMGGTGGGYTEIFTPGEGWRELKGVPTSTFSDQTSYPRAWVGNNGDVYVFAPGGGSNKTVELKVIDPSGNGSVKTLANLPFMTDWESPAIMYDAGKVLVMASNGELWTMDINGATPAFKKIGMAIADRNWSNMTVMANGDVLINGGTTSANKEAPGVTKAMIFDPDTGTLSSAGAEAHARVYHGTSILLPDGSIMSLGSGSSGSQETNYLDAQTYKPPYLFDENGKPAARPDIVSAPDVIVPGQTFQVTVDDANAIRDFTFIKTGATTHAFNMDARAVDVTFKVINGTTIEVTVPSDVNDVTAGSWMLFAWNDKGVPSVAEMVAVKPTLTHYMSDGTGGDPVDPNAPTYGDDILVNGALENGVTGSSLTAPMPGWTAEKYVETWTGAMNGATAPSSGKNYVEIDGGTGALSQSVQTEAGATYQLAFNFAGRSGSIASSKVDVYWNNEKIATITPADTNWKAYKFDVTGTGGADKLSFRPVAGDTDTVGGLLDRVSLRKEIPDDTNPPTDPDPDNMLSNGSFETVPGAHAGMPMEIVATNGQVGAWQSSTNRIEVWTEGKNSVAGTDGKNVVEVSAQGGTLAQAVKTEAGKYYGISFDYAGNPANIGSSKVEVLWNGVVIGTVTPDGSTMKNYHFHAHGTGGNDVLAFRSILGDTDNVGGLLDQVKLYVSDHGENPTTGNPINGTPGDDFLRDTTRDDVIKAGAGNDTIFLGLGGNDTVDGEGGDYNQVDLPGSASDYTFTRNADGTITVKSTFLGTDVLKNIHGFWFYDEAKWYGADQLAPEGNPGGNAGLTINADPAGGYYTGSDGDDTFHGGAGVDVFVGGKGDDVYYGGGGDYNQVDLAGKIAEWDFSRNADGSVTARHATYGTDTIHDIGGIWFEDANEWRAIDSMIA